MPSNALIILAEGFEEIEAVTAVDVLRRAEIEVTLAGLDNSEIKGAHGLLVKTDKNLNEAGSDYDACVLPGGMPGAANLAASIRRLPRCSWFAGYVAGHSRPSFGHFRHPAYHRRQLRRRPSALADRHRCHRGLFMVTRRRLQLRWIYLLFRSLRQVRACPRQQ